MDIAYFLIYYRFTCLYTLLHTYFFSIIIDSDLFCTFIDNLLRTDLLVINDHHFFIVDALYFAQ
jgi:hypothetical protein